MRQGICKNICNVVVLMVLVSGISGAGSALGQQVYYSGSAQYATGSYFFERSTNSFYLTNSIRIRGGAVSLSLNVPYMIQNSPWISYSGIGYIPTGGSQSETVSDMGKGRGKGGPDNSLPDLEPVILTDTVSYNKYGFSDPNLYLSVRLTPLKQTRTLLYLNASTKVPVTNSETGFGTGAWDFGVGLSLLQRIKTFFISADAMYWHLGDMEELNFKDPISFALGIGKSFNNSKWLVSGMVTGYTPIIEGYNPPMGLSVGLGYFLTSNIALNANISFGLSESSSDIGGGIGWSIRL